MALKSLRVLGIDLSGARTQKTSLALMEWFPDQDKIFLSDLITDVGDDTILVDQLQEVDPDWIAINAPISMPPCIGCQLPCPGASDCTVSEVQAMRELIAQGVAGTRKKARTKTVSPYTQRRVDLQLRYEIIPHLPESLRFEIDDPLGGSRAPLAARAQYLQRQFPRMRWVETIPKLTLIQLAQRHRLPIRSIKRYRDLEEGVEARNVLMEKLPQAMGVFLYDGDLTKLIRSLGAMDAFLSAWNGLQLARR